MAISNNSRRSRDDRAGLARYLLIRGGIVMLLVILLVVLMQSLVGHRLATHDIETTLQQTLKAEMLSFMILAAGLALGLLGVMALGIRRRAEIMISQRAEALSRSLESTERTLQTAISLEKTALRLTENIPVGTYVLEVNRRNRARFTFLSERFLRMLDLQREEVLRNPGVAFRCAHPDDFEGLMGLNEKVFMHRQAFSWEGRILLSNRTRWMSIEGFPRAGSNGRTIWEGVLIDITSRKEAEATLKLTYEKLTRAEVERSRLEERESLLQEMHDGFGSQLTSARILAERGQISHEQLSELLRECMADLYLVVDTLSDVNGTLSEAIVDLRYRTQRRLAGTELDLSWDIELTTLPPLSQRTILQIMRIIQEALNNALKHARAKSIIVEARHEGAVDQDLSGLLVVKITDDGDGISPLAREGRGISNMKSRSRAIGGRLSIDSGEQCGVTITLQLQTAAGTSGIGADQANETR